MSDSHTEFEIKFAADKVDLDAFMQFCMAHAPDRYIYIKGPDVYWTQGQNVVRHRHLAGSAEGAAETGAGELTVKRRKSQDSTLDRLEVDLRFDKCTTVEDVEKFLDASGWKRSFMLFKHAHIFWFTTGKVGVTVVLYKVKRISLTDKGQTKWRWFLEVEAGKGSSATLEEDREAVDAWRNMLTKRFALEDPLNESLYEIYAGKRYKVIK